jgi:plastocyanin
MRLLASRSAAAVLAAVAIPLPVYLVAAQDAAASTPDAAASTHDEAAAQTKAANRAQRRAEHRSRERAARQRRHRHGDRARTHTAAKHRDRTANGKSWKLAFPGASAAGGKRVHSNVSARAAAGDPADTISDFKFTPGTITIHVGDTVSWTNNGPTNHTATANDGSFNTGTLKKGQSASHTFTKAGTFAYICEIHPFMKGTIVVDASTSSSTPSSGSSGSGSSTSGSSGTGASTSGSSGATGSTGSSSGTTGTSLSGAGSPSPSPSGSGSSASLPVTGLDLSGAVLSGLGLLGAGALLRLRTRGRANAGQ